MKEKWVLVLESAGLAEMLLLKDEYSKTTWFTENINDEGLWTLFV